MTRPLRRWAVLLVGLCLLIQALPSTAVEGSARTASQQQPLSPSSGVKKALTRTHKVTLGANGEVVGKGSAPANATATPEEWQQLVSFLQRYEHLSGMMNAPHQAAFFQQQMQASGMVGGGPCTGLMNAMCKPCYKFPDQFSPCPDWVATCHKSFCMPLCLRLLWEVTFESTAGNDEFDEEFGEDHVQKALEAYMKAYGCQDILGCCPKDQGTANWSEQRVYQGMYPKPGAITACLKEPDRAKAQEMCKVTVTVAPIDGACNRFINPTKPEDNDHSSSAFERAGVPAAAELPAHKSFRERCEAMQELIGGMAGAMQSAMEEVVCACLGCDESSKCPHRVMFDNAPEAMAEFDSDLMAYNQQIQGGE